MASECDAIPELEADAIINDDPHLVPIISTADCAPLLIACLASRSCAAIHAGWRGAAQDIVGVAVHRMVVQFGAVPSRMVAAIGPCARGERYEVGVDVVEAFHAQGLADALLPSRLPGKAFADCSVAARILLLRAGMLPMAIDDTAPCTIADVRFASHRREPQNTVRMLAGIAVPR